MTYQEKQLLAKCLYAINKYAKRAKKCGNKQEQQELYNLKNRVLRSLSIEEIHQEFDFINGKMKYFDYLAFYRIGNYSFHSKLTEKQVNNLIKNADIKVNKIKKINSNAVFNKKLIDKDIAVAVCSSFVLAEEEEVA